MPMFIQNNPLLGNFSMPSEKYTVLYMVFS